MTSTEMCICKLNPPQVKDLRQWGGEIISRKATDLDDIQLSTFETYLNEMNQKYAPGTSINAPKYGDDLKGKVLEGNLILEIPDNNKSLSNIQEYIDLAKSKNIELRFRPE
jgi:hypothetical protein